MSKAIKGLLVALAGAAVAAPAAQADAFNAPRDVYRAGDVQRLREVGHPTDVSRPTDVGTPSDVGRMNAWAWQSLVRRHERSARRGDVERLLLPWASRNAAVFGTWEP
jgi:hypothetical protein